MRRFLPPLVLSIVSWIPLAACGSAGVQEEKSSPSTRSEGLPSVADFTAGLRRVDGALPFAWKAAEGRLYAEVEPGRELLYVVSLSAGLGSNDVGLDRGQLGDQRLVVFRDVGDRVLLVAPNLDWRTSSTDPAERAGVRDAFAESVLWGFEPVARTGERVLVDATDFLLRDAHGIARRLEDADQGSFSLERSRSTLLGDSLRGFPENSDVEGLYTYLTQRPGGEVRATAADPRAVTFRVRHSFVVLPELGTYRPRAFDPRSGYYPHAWHDLASAIDAPLERRVVTRHRLTPDEPIVYFVDRAAPEPVRTALLEGGRYWQPAFAAAGFPDGFRVELLPEGADPYDVRYNVIQWVNRSTRGWSYGSTVTDPRTGEILKGHVTLGALRVRQDVLLFEGLTAPYAGDVDHAPEVLAAALARIRQLSAHEIGHTLGLAHNFAASADDRASVMDYPAPLVRLAPDGSVDLSDAYAPGAGPWDTQAIRYGYTEFAAGDEAAGLAAILAESETQGLRYLTDRDARGFDRAHPDASLWDNGADPVDALRESYAVRATALARFGESAIRRGRPLFELELVLLPLYLHHRFQLEAAARAVGGVHYDYALRDGTGEVRTVRPVDAVSQRRALAAALESLEPGFLALSPDLLELLAPPPPGWGRDRETFDPGALLFDPLLAAATSAQMTADVLLDPERLARLEDQARRDPAQLSLEEVLARVLELGWRGPRPADAEVAAIRDEVRGVLLGSLLRLARGRGVPERVQARALVALHELRDLLSAAAVDVPHVAWERELLRRFFEDPATDTPEPRTYRVPPGSPIGCGTR